MGKPDTPLKIWLEACGTLGRIRVEATILQERTASAGSAKSNDP